LCGKVRFEEKGKSGIVDVKYQGKRVLTFHKADYVVSTYEQFFWKGEFYFCITCKQGNQFPIYVYP
jgi:hypothetical protein